jgi:hypothetical protein
MMETEELLVQNKIAGIGTLTALRQLSGSGAWQAAAGKHPPPPHST